MEAEKKIVVNNDTTPFGKSWNFLYTFVIGELALLVVLFYIFTKVFE